MARYGPADCSVTYAAQAIADCTVISDIDAEALLEEITPLGSGGANETHGYIGVKRYPEITLEAPYSDDSNLLRDKVDDTGLGGTATLVILFGGSKSFTISTLVKSTRRRVQRGAFTVFSVTLQPTGAATEA